MEFVAFLLLFLNYVLKEYYPVYIVVDLLPWLPIKIYFYDYNITAGMKLGPVRIYFHNYSVIVELVTGFRILSYSIIATIFIFICLVAILIESERNILKEVIVETIIKLFVVYNLINILIKIIGVTTLSYQLVAQYVVFVKIFILLIDFIVIVSIIRYLYKFLKTKF